MTEVKKPDPDAEHDSARLWFERAGRLVLLAVQARRAERRHNSRARKLGTGGSSERVLAQSYCGLKCSYLKQAKRFSREAERAEKLGRL